MLFALTTVVMLSSGGLLSERVPAQGLLVGAVDLSTLPVEQLSLAELEKERLRLEDERPGLGLGIGLIIGGGVADILGLAIAAYSYSLAGVVIGLSILTVGIVATVFGIVFLVKGIRGRHQTSARLHAVETRITQIRKGQVVEPPPNEDIPLPPPPVPAAWREGADASMLVATF